MRFVSVFEFRFESFDEYVKGNKIFDDFVNTQPITNEIKETAVRCSDPLCVAIGTVENRTINLLMLAQALSNECIGGFKFLEGVQ